MRPHPSGVFICLKYLGPSADIAKFDLTALFGKNDPKFRVDLYGFQEIWDFVVDKCQISAIVDDRSARTAFLPSRSVKQNCPDLRSDNIG
jgi:hypothetical protein